VTAVDASARMVAEARARATALRHLGEVDVRHLAIEELANLGDTFDAAYSSFGPLNCVIGLEPVADVLAGLVRPGGVLVASVIGRVCPWEIACFAWKRDPARIAARFSREAVPVPLGAETIWTRYYSAREFARPFTRAGFVRVALRALGLFVPPPYLDGTAARYPRVTAALQAIEDGVASWPIVRGAGDHFVIVLRRC
jgi:SAM-dependent methyltransferase